MCEHWTNIVVHKLDLDVCSTGRRCSCNIFGRTNLDCNGI